MRDSEFRSLCETILSKGLKILGLKLGLVSQIDQDSYLLLSVMPKACVFKAGEAFELRDTYCREIVRTGETIALTEVEGVRGLCKHPLYSGLPLEAYIGSPIVVNDRVWGTLNFSSMKIREHDFSNEEIKLIENWAASIGEYISVHH